MDCKDCPYRFAFSVSQNTVKEYAISMSDLTSPSRARHLVLARRALIQALHWRGLSHEQIGELLHRDRSTITYHLGKSWDS